MTVVMHAELPIDPDSRDEALELVEELAVESRAEDGVVDYRATADVEEPNTVRIVEQYRDDDAVDAHMSSDHFRSFQGAIGDHLAGEPSLYRFDVDETTRVM